MTSPDRTPSLCTCFRSLFRPPFPTVCYALPLHLNERSHPATPDLRPSTIVCVLVFLIYCLGQGFTKSHPQAPVKLLSYPIYTSLIPCPSLVQIREGRPDGLYSHILRTYPRVSLYVFEFGVPLISSDKLSGLPGGAYFVPFPHF